MAEALPEYPDSDFSDDDLSSLDINFNKATQFVKKNTNKFNSTELMELYGLYKQGTEGKCNIPKPSWYDMWGRKKWEAWRQIGDITSDTAKEKYIALIQKHDPNWLDPSGGNETWVSVSTLRNPDEPDIAYKDLSLIDAARENCAEKITQLLSKNPDLKHDKDEDGLTALHWAADRDAVDSLKAAVAGGCPINAQDDSGQTPLHYAVTCGHVESTKILINAGALLLEDEDGKTPLDLAENEEIRQILDGAK